MGLPGEPVLSRLINKTNQITSRFSQHNRPNHMCINEDEAINRTIVKHMLLQITWHTAMRIKTNRTQQHLQETMVAYMQ